VGLDAADDAAVYLVARDVAIVETLDFFRRSSTTPTRQARSALPTRCRCLRDGREVLFVSTSRRGPRTRPLAQLERVFQGAIDKVAEAGGVVAGGHTVIDREPKYGLAVTGRVHPERVLLSRGCAPVMRCG